MGNLEDRMRCARAFANLSQQELADRLGVSIGTVKRREIGDAPVTNEILSALAQATGVPFAFLVEGWSDDQLNASMAEVLARVDRLEDPPVLPGPDSLPGD